MRSKRLILIELNELNFDVVSEYIAKGLPLPNFEKLLAYESRVTSSESQYQLLEPWIQWPSVHTGQDFDRHQIFRLGDAAVKKPTQLFELIENRGFKVGAVSPMNAANNLERAEYFIPDPWTHTPSDGSLLSNMLTKALRQTVNDNSEGQITLQSILYLVACFLCLVRPGSYWKLLIKAVKSRGKPWRKALFLDRFLHEVHFTLFTRRKPNFSTVFFNAGAHIQHHYFLNSSSKLVQSRGNPAWYISPDEDPLEEMLLEYDEILGDLLSNDRYEILVATGLTQVPVEDTVFYYRLRDHAAFLATLDLPAFKVLPRMTRDFLVSCDSPADAALVETKLKQIVTRDGEEVFGEVDNRGSDLFVVLDYSQEITNDTEILLGDEWHHFISDVVFVAVKNGKHDGRGFSYFSSDIEAYAPSADAHVSNLFHTVSNYYGVNATDD